MVVLFHLNLSSPPFLAHVVDLDLLVPPNLRVVMVLSAPKCLNTLCGV